MRHMILPSLVSKPTGSVRSRLPRSPRVVASRFAGGDHVLPPSVLRVANAWACTAPQRVTVSGGLEVECPPSAKRTSVPFRNSNCHPVSIFFGSLGQGAAGSMGVTFVHVLPLSLD